MVLYTKEITMSHSPKAGIVFKLETDVHGTGTMETKATVTVWPRDEGMVYRSFTDFNEAKKFYEKMCEKYES